MHRDVKPAPLVPDMPAPGSAAEGADAAALAAAATSSSSESVYGSLPAVVLDPLIEHVREQVQASADLEGMLRTLTNAWCVRNCVCARVGWLGCSGARLLGA